MRCVLSIHGTVLSENKIESEFRLRLCRSLNSDSLVFFSRGHSAANVPLCLVHIKQRLDLVIQRRVEMLQPFSDVFMYRCCGRERFSGCGRRRIKQEMGQRLHLLFSDFDDVSESSLCRRLQVDVSRAVRPDFDARNDSFKLRIAHQPDVRS